MPSEPQPSQVRGNTLVLLVSGSIATLGVWPATRSGRRALSLAIILAGTGFVLRHARSRRRVVFAVAVMAILSIAVYYVAMQIP
jgi:hypothetical protein